MTKANSNILFLDMDVERTADFVRNYPHAHVVSTASQCIMRLEELPSIDVLFLDSDVNTPKYGADVVQYLVAYPELRKKIAWSIVHSTNSSGDKLVDDLKDAEYFVSRIPFITFKRVFKRWE